MPTPKGLSRGIALGAALTAVTAGGLTAAAPAMAGPGEATSTIEVTGQSGVIQDLDLTTDIRHGFSWDLEVLLTSPEGTVVPITTQNPGLDQSSEDVFAGTVWDDDAGDPVTDHTGWTDGVAATPLTPEAALGAFIGEDPNGTWTLTVRDTDPTVSGTLESWGLEIDVASPPPTPAAEAPEVQDDDAVIPDATPDASTPEDDTDVVPGSVATSLTVGGTARFIQDVDLQTGILHTATGDLTVRLSSPAGTTVVLSSDNGFGKPDWLNGTVFDDDARLDDDTSRTRPISDEPASDTAVPTAVPEGAMAAFVGEDPRGTWQLEVIDGALADTGTLDRWELRLSTVTELPSVSTTTSASSDTPTPIPDATEEPEPEPEPEPGDGGGTPPPTGGGGTPSVVVTGDELCLAEQKPATSTGTPGRVTVSLGQLRINQRIYQAAVRRANAIQNWLDDGIVERDLCGGAIGTRELGAGVATGVLSAKQTLTPPAPRAIVEARASSNPNARFSLSAAQLLINQRVAQAAVRRANGLQQRLDAGLTGGDVRDGAVSQAKLNSGLAVTATSPAAKPAASTTPVAVVQRSGSAAADVTLSASQLLINQRIGQAAIRRLNALRASLESGLGGDDFRPDTITSSALAPGLGS